MIEQKVRMMAKSAFINATAQAVDNITVYNNSPSIVVGKTISREHIYTLKHKYPIYEIGNILSVETEIYNRGVKRKVIEEFLNSDNRTKILVIHVDRKISKNDAFILMKLKYLKSIGNATSEMVSVNGKVLIVLMSDNDKYLDLGALKFKYPKLFKESFYI